MVDCCAESSELDKRTAGAGEAPRAAFGSCRGAVLANGVEGAPRVADSTQKSRDATTHAATSARPLPLPFVRVKRRHGLLLSRPVRPKAKATNALLMTFCVLGTYTSRLRPPTQSSQILSVVSPEIRRSSTVSDRPTPARRRFRPARLGPAASPEMMRLISAGSLRSLPRSVCCRSSCSPVSRV